MIDAHAGGAPDTEGGPEWMQPGHRSGEGVGELSRYIRRDERRRAGSPPQERDDDAQRSPAEPDRPG